MLPPADSTSPRTTADRSEGWATNRPAVSPVKLNRTIYLAIAIPLQGACRPDRCLPSSIAPVTTSGNTRDRTSGGRLRIADRVMPALTGPCGSYLLTGRNSRFRAVAEKGNADPASRSVTVIPRCGHTGTAIRRGYDVEAG